MSDYNLTQRTAHSLTEVDAENPEKTLIDDYLLEIDIVRSAVEMINGNFPREQVQEAYDNFMEFMHDALVQYTQLKYGAYDLDQEVQIIQEHIMDAEHEHYSYLNKEQQLKTQIDNCGFFHPFRKAELKTELAELQKGGVPKLPIALYQEMREKTVEFEQKNKMFQQLDKDFNKLNQIGDKMKEKLEPARALAQSIKAKRHK